VSDRLELVRVIVESIQETPNLNPNRTRAIRQMKGSLKTEKPAPTDEKVEAMLEQHRLEKYF
jgi:hypothetical protein